MRSGSKPLCPTLVVLLAACAALLLAACGSDDESGGSDGGGDGEQPSVRTIHPGKVDQGTWDPAQHQAYEAAAEEGNWDLEVAEAVAYGEAAELFDRWGREGVDVVFGIDAGYEEDLLRAAEEYPDTAWVMMTALSDTMGLENVASYSINWCQVGYAQGAIAALASETGTIANVGAIQILPAELIIEGEKHGIEATGKDIEVITEYSGDFLAADKAAELASAVTDEADVVIEVTNGAVAPQLAARVQEEGAGYVGTYLDSNSFAPDAHVATVTSDFSKDYGNVVQAWMDGSFEPEQVTRGFEDGVLAISPFGENYKDIEEEARELIDSMEFPSTGQCADAG